MVRIVDENGLFVYFIKEMKMKVIWHTLLGIFSLLILSGILFLLYISYTFISHKEYSCGPSEEAGRPIVQVMVKELNKRNNFLNRIKLEEFNDLPYKLVDCEDEMVKRGYTSQKLTDSKEEDIIEGRTSQTCYYQNKTERYAIKWGIRLTSRKKNGDYLMGCRPLFVSIRKDESDKYDLSWREYFISCDRKKSAGNMQEINVWELDLFTSIDLTNQSKGLCGYSFNLRLD